MVENRLSAFWQNKRILITGGAGFLGSHVVDNLVAKRGVERGQITIPRNKTVDLRKWDDCQKATQNLDVVIHLAARVGEISNYSFSNVTDNHTISVTSEAIASTSPTPSPSPYPSPSPSPTPFNTPSTLSTTPSASPKASNSPSSSPMPATTNKFPIQTAAIVASAVAALVVVFALALKKGYITIEVVDEEENGQEEDDYPI